MHALSRIEELHRYQHQAHLSDNALIHTETIEQKSRFDAAFRRRFIFRGYVRGLIPRTIRTNVTEFLSLIKRMFFITVKDYVTEFDTHRRQRLPQRRWRIVRSPSFLPCSSRSLVDGFSSIFLRLSSSRARAFSKVPRGGPESRATALLRHGALRH